MRASTVTITKDNFDQYKKEISKGYKQEVFRMSARMYRNIKKSSNFDEYRENTGAAKQVKIYHQKKQLANQN